MVIPTPQELVSWAKQNNFKFKQNSFGNEKCGCALTALCLMKNPGKFKVEDVDFILRCFNLNAGMQFNIIRGFDSPYIPIDEEYRNWGRSVYNLSKQEGILL